MRLLYSFCCILLLSLSTSQAESSATTMTVDGEGRICKNGICTTDHPSTHHGDDDFILEDISVPCQDLRPYCAERVDTCQTNWKFMHPHCPKTCNVCHNLTRTVEKEDFGSLKGRGQRPIGVTFREQIVDVSAADLGVPQLLDPYGTGEWQEDIMDVIFEAREYVEDVVMVEHRYEKVRDTCKNHKPQCALFAARGECDTNPDWMDEHCAPFCQTCHLLHIDARCPLNRNAKHAWYPGDLNRMFERIISDPDIVERFQPKVWARPSLAPGDSRDQVDYLIGSPWVVTLENFISASEAKFLIDAGGEIGYERSADVGEEQEDGSYGDEINEGRTSENAWCEDECKENPVTVEIMQRMEFVTGIPVNNSEALQLLRYEVGQFYKVHHDYITHEIDRVQGPRILTVFLYLNEVEQGGETRFHDLDLKVPPKLGRALLWPSVTDENPLAFEPLTHHEALPVIKGIKYGANSWFHLMDVVGPEEFGC